MDESQSYLDAKALFAREGWKVQLDDEDSAEKYVLTAIPPEGGKGIAVYALTPELAIWQAWAEFAENRQKYAR